MKIQTMIITVMAALLLFGGDVLAAKPPDAGNGGGGGSGDSGEPPDLGDLIKLYRDPDGVPYLTLDSCWQPFPTADCPVECLVFGDDGDEATTDEPSVVEVDPLTCAIPPQCATCTEEVDFGRINDVRSPDAVLQAQLEDVIVNLATADCLSLDPAGRLVTSRVADDWTITTSAIDSPLQNLAIYKQLILTGDLGAPLPDGAGILDTAARGLGAGSDKSGKVNVDMVAYLNQIMGLAEEGVTTILGNPICIDIKQEVAGQVQLVKKCFLDFAAYDYDRDTNFGALPAPAYIPEDVPVAGTFEYLSVLDPSIPSFEIVRGLITTGVFEDQPAESSNIEGFAQAADDTRAVIDFMHSNPLPAEYVTPVPCSADPGGLTSYDVSISDISGLQVPKRIVDGSEGREFTVSVANAGPDPASGIVTVTADAANGVGIVGSPWVFTFTDLSASASESFIQFFTVNLGERTTIDWSATVVAPDDVNPGNNVVTESTSVKVTGGGGGGGKP